MTSMTPYELKPNDRIVFGTGSVFLYKNKDRGSESMPDDPEISFLLPCKKRRCPMIRRALLRKLPKPQEWRRKPN